ncbi:MAG: methylmalonyl-CoA mutase, partial [Bacteroidetes bacterium]
AMTSYQGGHVEYLKYMYDLLQERKAGHIKIFAGGGGTILPSEIQELENYGICKIYSPDDGRRMGLQGMINDLLEKADFSVLQKLEMEFLKPSDHQQIAQLISLAENEPEKFKTQHSKLNTQHSTKIPVLGITGTGGAGKSSLIDELIRRFLLNYSNKTLAIISVDPSKRKTGGALLGDRIRMNAIDNPRIYMRSLATRQSNLSMSKHVKESIQICKSAGFDWIIVETSGIGQSDTEITEHSDLSLYVMTSEYGAATQLEKIDMLDFADIIAINKFDKKGSLDALRDVRKQYRRNRNFWEGNDEDLPIFGTMASQFNDVGMNILFEKIMNNAVFASLGKAENDLNLTGLSTSYIIPPDRVRYLAEIVENSDSYDQFVKNQCQIARKLYQILGTIQILSDSKNFANLSFVEKIDLPENPDSHLAILIEKYNELAQKLDFEARNLLKNWENKVNVFTAEKYQFKVRGKIIEQDLYSETLSHLKIPKVSLPKYHDFGDILQWLLTENIAGEFPYAAGVFPLKRENEDPARMFAGEGDSERTNKRFHYVSSGMPAKRLSTAFDSVTLYGENPDERPDIYGKIGNSGVSVATLDEAKKLYSGFDLCDPATSVSMTINGPAPMVLAFFMNAAIDQQCEKYILQN